MSTAKAQAASWDTFIYIVTGASLLVALMMAIDFLMVIAS